MIHKLVGILKVGVYAKMTTDECEHFKLQFFSHHADMLNSLQLGPRPAGQSRADGNFGTAQHIPTHCHFESRLFPDLIAT